MADVKAFFVKNWIWFAIALVVIIALVVVYYEVYQSGNTAGTSSVLANIPNPSTGAPYTTSELQSVRSYTTWLDGEFHWYSIHNMTQWNALALDTDRILIGVSNQYALDYATPGVSTSGTGNLYNDIQGAYFVAADLSLNNSPATVATRLKALLNL